jgi:hypothetical protein
MNSKRVFLEAKGNLERIHCISYSGLLFSEIFTAIENN